MRLHPIIISNIALRKSYTHSHALQPRIAHMEASWYQHISKWSRFRQRDHRSGYHAVKLLLIASCNALPQALMAPPALLQGQAPVCALWLELHLAHMFEHLLILSAPLFGQLLIPQGCRLLPHKALNDSDLAYLLRAEVSLGMLKEFYHPACRPVKSWLCHLLNFLPKPQREAK